MAKNQKKSAFTKSLGTGLLVSLLATVAAGYFFHRFVDGFTAGVMTLVCFYLFYLAWRSLENHLSKKL